MSKIERLRALLAEATPGPWKADETTDQFTDLFDEDERPDRTGWFRECGVGSVDVGDYSTLTWADAALIAAAVNALPALLDERDALRAALYNCGLAAQSGAQAMAAHKRGGWEKHHYIMETARDALDRLDGAS